MWTSTLQNNSKNINRHHYIMDNLRKRLRKEQGCMYQNDSCFDCPDIENCEFKKLANQSSNP